jgi:hypothetical protein
MQIFDAIHKQDIPTEVALLKQEAVLSLWKSQSRVIEIVNRAFQSGCVQEIQVRAWTRSLNSHRRIIQDGFLLETTSNAVKERIQEANSKYDELVSS